MLKQIFNPIVKGLRIKSFATKFGIMIFLIGFSVLLIFLAGIVALLGTFWTNIK